MAVTEGEVVRCAENGHLFECIKLLRRCKCGEVWFAVRSEPPGQVVLKVIDKVALQTRRADDEEHKRASFDAPEVDFATLSFLNFHGHAHIIRAADVSFATETRMVAVLEFMPGGDLLDLVARHRRFDEPTSRHFFLQIVRAVSYMHGLRVAHLDLSLENVVLSADRRVAKLIDFGLACKSELGNAGEELPSACGARGKLFYVAPEVFADGNFRPRVADMWSLGIMLFIMLTGSPPLDAGPCDRDTRFPFIRDRKIGAILKAWKMDKDISPLLLDLLGGLLCVDPARRLTMAQLEAHPWINPSAGAPAHVGPASTASVSGSASGSGAPSGGAGAGAGAGTAGGADVPSVPTVPMPAPPAVPATAGGGDGGLRGLSDLGGSMEFDIDDLDILNMPDVDMTA